jgi:PhnB protein
VKEESDMAERKTRKGHHTVTPGMVVPGVSRLIDFLKKVLDAVEVDRMTGPNGHIMHAEVTIGDSLVMLGEPTDAYPATPCMLTVYVDDVDARYKLALAEGATSVREPADQFYGDRTAGVRDPSGNTWWLHAFVEEVSKEEMERRLAAMMPKG